MQRNKGRFVIVVFAMVVLLTIQLSPFNGMTRLPLPEVFLALRPAGGGSSNSWMAFNAGSSSTSIATSTKTGKPTKATLRYKRQRVAYQQIPLDELTRSSEANITCGASTFPVYNQKLGPTTAQQQKGYNIPRRIHQTSRSRCVIQEFADTANKWKEFGWEFYFHDDQAVDRLVHHFHPAFPMLPVVWDSVVKQGTMKADLWRQLVLYEYGGLFSDLDSMPNHLTNETIRPDDDSLFVVDVNNGTSFHLMALAPKHPLLFISLQTSITNLILNTKRTLHTVNMAGPTALYRGITLDLRLGENNIDVPDVLLPAGEYKSGVDAKMIRILGDGVDIDYWVVRDIMSKARKDELYQKFMNMTYFATEMKQKGKKLNTSCAVAIMNRLQTQESKMLSLGELTSSDRSSVCPDKTFAVENQFGNRTREGKTAMIPRIIHQIAPSRCMSVNDHTNFVDPLRSSLGEQWDYYLHDHHAMNQFIFDNVHPAFEAFQLIYESCAVSGLVKESLWKLLVLWEYGGVVSTLGLYPDQTVKEILDGTSDAVLFAKQRKTNNSTSLSYTVDVMAASPKHPLIFYTLHIALNRLLMTISEKSTCEPLVFKQVIESSVETALLLFLNTHPFQVNDVIQTTNRILKANGNELIGQEGKRVHILIDGVEDTGIQWIVDDRENPSVNIHPAKSPCPDSAHFLILESNCMAATLKNLM